MVWTPIHDIYRQTHLFREVGTLYTSLAVSAALILFLIWLKRKKVSFGIRVLVAMLLGVAVGALFGKDAEIVGFLGMPLST